MFWSIGLHPFSSVIAEVANFLPDLSQGGVPMHSLDSFISVISSVREKVDGLVGDNT